MRTIAVHAPALTLQEAAMLPALMPEKPGKQLRSGLPDRGQPVDNPSRRGTMGGRALLTYIRSAPARRQRR